MDKAGAVKLKFVLGREFKVHHKICGAIRAGGPAGDLPQELQHTFVAVSVYTVQEYPVLENDAAFSLAFKYFFSPH